MIASLCKELSTYLGDNLNWLEKKHGLVFVNKVDVPGIGKVNVPFEWGTEECRNDNFVSPDTAKRSVSWFETEGVAVKSDMEGGVSLYASQVTFCNWINTSKIDKDDAFVADRLVFLADRQLAGIKNLTLGDYRIVRTSVAKITIGNDKVLAKYGFTDKAKVSSVPYFGYSITMNFQFQVLNCNSITLNPC